MVSTKAKQAVNNPVRNAIFSVLLLAVSLGLCLLAAEAFLRLKNSAMTNYDIEMWRYANELKHKSDDPALDFDHLRSKKAVLQNTEIRLNSWGLRGPEPVAEQPELRRILFLGGSITLGWGVAEESTLEARLQRKLADLGENVEVLNGGVGNYNTERYVSRFFKELTALKPTDIVVHYFLRDAEQLPPGGGNFLLRHSELAVTLWIAYHRLLDKHGETSLVEHYKNVYDPAAPGFQVMQAKLRELADFAKHNNIRIYLAMVPDVHNLIDYKFGFVHETMRKIAEADGYVYVDLLPAMLGHPPEQLWAMPGDPHPNAFGHQLMSDAILPVLAGKGAATTATTVQN
jgi:lysophospholipase L1-like esterase